ncbi:MAG: transposase, partial [Patescibacteria group bacterium]
MINFIYFFKMPRKARQIIISQNTLYHVVSRGNNQQKIFRKAQDFKKFLKIIKKTKEQYPFYFYSYSLLPNHYHLQIETQETPISKIMHKINFLYAIYFRKRYKGSGHLFQERFFCKAINKDSYFWELGAYINLNAVKAKLTKKPENYKWSSCLFYYKKDYNENLIDQKKFLEYIDEDFEKARRIY